MITGLFWRPLPVTALTLRQFTAGRSLWVVAIFSFLPCLFAAIYSFGIDEPAHDWVFFYVQELYRGLVVATLLPIVTLILATGAFGNEIEDRTLHYLTLKPVSRWRLVLEKYLGVLLVAIPLQVAGLTAAWLIVFHQDIASADAQNSITAVLPSAVAAICAYGAVFLLVSLWMRRALLAGVFYVLIWESLFGRFLEGLKLVSIRHYAESIAVGLLDHPDVILKGANSVIVSVVVLAVITLFALSMSARRLKRLNII